MTHTYEAPVVHIRVNDFFGVHPARVIRENREGRRLLDLDGGPLLVEGVDCEVVPAPEMEAACLD
jgi:hypothetical protein